MPQASIYALCEPDGVTVRYVGRTSRDVGARYTEHMDKARLALRRDDRHIHKTHQWIVGLLRQDKTPVVVHLADCSASQAAEVEAEWIVAFQRNGCDLVNTAHLSRTVSQQCPHCGQTPLLSIGRKNA